jgi:chorismate mutase
MAQDKLDELRASIDDFDEKIVEALAGRQRAVEVLAKLKIERGLPLRDVAREAEHLAKLSDFARKQGVSGWTPQASMLRRRWRLRSTIWRAPEKPRTPWLCS